MSHSQEKFQIQKFFFYHKVLKILHLMMFSLDFQLNQLANFGRNCLKT